MLFHSVAMCSAAALSLQSRAYTLGDRKCLVSDTESNYSQKPSRCYCSRCGELKETSGHVQFDSLSISLSSKLLEEGH